MNKSMEEFFDAAPHEEIEAIDAEIVNETSKEIKKSAKETDIIKADDLSIVKREEVRENYELSQNTLAKNLDVGGKLLDQISANLAAANIEIGKQNKLYESAGALMRSLTETAKVLTSLHQDAGTIFGDVNKIEIDNSQNNFPVGPEALQQLADLTKQFNGISTDGSEE